MTKRYDVIISDRAGELLVQHVRFLAQVSVTAAEKPRVDVVKALKSLEDFPERGSWLTDPLFLAHKYRKLLVVQRYLLIYQIKEDTIYIDYLADCRQNYGWLI